MRIGINALYLIPGGVGGTEIYLRHLLRALSEIDASNEYVVFTNRETGEDLAPAASNFRVAPQKVRAVDRPARILWEQFRLPGAAARERLDVLLNPGFTAPLAAAVPNVTVFHDLQHKRHPEYFRWFDLPAWRFFLWGAVHGSRILLADSEATRSDLLRYYRVPESRVRTVPLGVDPYFFNIARERCGRASKPYILCASTLHPHKNLLRLVGVHAELRRGGCELDLAITGVRGFHADAVEAATRGEHVRLTGWLPREELYALFRDAHSFVYPSTFEGFGLPVLEALAAGLPAACSAIEPLRSMVGGAAITFDPDDEQSMLNALRRVTSDAGLRAKLAEAGPRRASAFSWQTTARLTLEALCEAARTASR